MLFLDVWPKVPRREILRRMCGAVHATPTSSGAENPPHAKFYFECSKCRGIAERRSISNFASTHKEKLCFHSRVLIKP